MAEDTNADERSYDVVRWYTRARRFPKLVGRFPDGRAIWGGPYTVLQLVGGGVMLGLLFLSKIVWAHFGGIGNLAFAAVVTAATVWGLGRVSQSGRSPLSRLTGLGRVVTRSTGHKIDGRNLRISAPHVVLGDVEVFDTTSSTSSAQTASAHVAADIAVVVAAETPPPAPSPPSPPTQVPHRVVRHRAGSPTPAAVAGTTSHTPPWIAHPSAPARSADTPSSVPAAASAEPRVHAAAGTGVAQLLALAADANRKS